MTTHRHAGVAASLDHLGKCRICGAPGTEQSYEDRCRWLAGDDHDLRGPDSYGERRREYDRLAEKEEAELWR